MDEKKEEVKKPEEKKPIELKPNTMPKPRTRKVIIETNGRTIGITHNECTVLELREIGRQLMSMS